MITTSWSMVMQLWNILAGWHGNHIAVEAQHYWNYTRDHQHGGTCGMGRTYLPEMCCTAQWHGPPCDISSEWVTCRWHVVGLMSVAVHVVGLMCCCCTCDRTNVCRCTCGRTNVCCCVCGRTSSASQARRAKANRWVMSCAFRVM